MKIKYILVTSLFIAGLLQTAVSQISLPPNPNLEDYIEFALQNRGQVQQRVIDEEIGEREIASALSDWFPQIAASANYNRNIIVPTNVIGDQVIRMGQPHTSAMVLQVDQQILQPHLLQASKAARFIRENNYLNTALTKTNTVVDVSKAYYDILTSYEQLNIVRENIARIQQQLEDSEIRYQTGIVDKTDFKRAQISLANARADLKRVEELLIYKQDYFKELIGMDAETPLNIRPEVDLEEEFLAGAALLDTTTLLQEENRIEYQQIQTLQNLQRINTQYNKWQFLPGISAFYNYAWDFRAPSYGQLYQNSSPRSVFGLSLRLPIFEGTRRVQEIRRSQLLEERLDWDLINLRRSIQTEHSMALASYRANLSDWNVARGNVALSEEVYEVIKLQYDEGIKTYLDLMMAETDLRTSQINYLNALYAVLSAKLDVQKALGLITIK